jgi:hypothetical protein
MAKVSTAKDPRWTLAQCRVSRTELRLWHEAARTVDLRLAQAMRKQMRAFVEAQLGTQVTR